VVLALVFFGDGAPLQVTIRHWEDGIRDHSIDHVVAIFDLPFVVLADFHELALDAAQAYVFVFRHLWIKVDLLDHPRHPISHDASQAALDKRLVDVGERFFAKVVQVDIDVVGDVDIVHVVGLVLDVLRRYNGAMGSLGKWFSIPCTGRLVSRKPPCICKDDMTTFTFQRTRHLFAIRCMVIQIGRP